MNREYLSGPELKYNRLSLGITVKDLSVASGMSPSKINLIEKFAVITQSDYEKYTLGLKHITKNPYKFQKIVGGLKEYVVTMMACCGLPMDAMEKKFGISRGRIKRAMKTFKVYDLYCEVSKQKKIQEKFLETIDSA